MQSLLSSKNIYTSRQNKLNENTYFLDEEYILNGYRSHGDSRYPYTNDGLTIWAHSSGYISINESNFFIIPPALEGKEPFLNIYAGLKKNNEYEINSILGLNEYKKDRSKVIYSPHGAIYLLEKNNVTFAYKITINDKKEILSSIVAFNYSSKNQDVLLSTFINPLMMHTASESEETKWFKKVEVLDDGATFLGLEDLSREIHLTNYGVLKRCLNSDAKIAATSSRMDIARGKNLSINNHESLKNGQFLENKKITQFNETAAFSDIIKKTLKPKEYIQIDYVLSITFDEKTYQKLLKSTYPFGYNDIQYALLKNDYIKREKDFYFKLKFENINPKYKVNDELLNKFLKQVINQVDYGTRTKNSSLMQLGIRDLFQMIECSLLWNDKLAKEKIILALNVTLENGRCLRQFSLPTNGEEFLVDSREFIDQGQWVISTIYQYLSFTNDRTLLNAKCKYAELVAFNKAKYINKSDTVYNHLITILNYLISNIDESSHLLKTLYGDWNDAVDGLGRNYVKDATGEYSNGVSAMASMHLFKNLNEMEEIILLVDSSNSSMLNKIKRTRKNLEKAILTKLIHHQNDESRIIHGYGENESYYVGSFNDVDKQNRTSLTSHATFVTSGLYEKHKSFKKVILNSYEKLDSKYGYKTFDTPFYKDAYKVGRIVNLPVGTAENAATYIHGSMFAFKSLLMMNEPLLSYSQLFKLLPITHEKLSTTPFVMPNSYVYNPDLGLDGESMSDWYTGSSNTLLKALVFDMFGVKPKLNNTILIKPVSAFFSSHAELQLKIKGKRFKIIYDKANKLKGKIKINNEIIDKNLINIDNYESNDVIEIKC